MHRIGIGMLCVLLIGASLAAQEPARTEGLVVLPLDEYRALRARAFPSPPDPAPPPVDAALTRVDYDLRIGTDTAAGEARLAVDVLKQGWVGVQVPSGLLVRAARLDGRPTTIVDGHPPRLLLARTGRSTIALDVAAPLSSSGGSESMTLPPAGSALSVVTLVIPRIAVDLTVSGGLVTDQTESAGQTRWIVYGAPGRALTFTWKRRVDDGRAALPLRTRAHVVELVTLGEDSTQVTTSVRLDVVQGIARQVVVALPPDVVVNQVTGATVADWNPAPNALTVTFLEPIASQVSFVISADTRTPREGQMSVPLVRVPSAERETGGIAVDVAGEGEISDRQPKGLDPADSLDLGDFIAGRESPSMAAFEYTPSTGSSARSLSVAVTRYIAQSVLVANVEEARYEALLAEDGKCLVRVRYALRSNQRSFLAVTLPANSTLWSASVAGRLVRPGVAAEGDILLPLERARRGDRNAAFVVELTYLSRLPALEEKGQARLDLPAVDLPVARTGVTVHYSPRLDVTGVPGTFRETADPGPWAPALRATTVSAESPAPAPSAAVRGDDATNAMQALVDRFNRDAGRPRQGIVPVDIQFPAMGPSIFLASELTAESSTPSLTLEYHRKGGR